MAVHAWTSGFRCVLSTGTVCKAQRPTSNWQHLSWPSFVLQSTRLQRMCFTPNKPANNTESRNDCKSITRCLQLFLKISRVWDLTGQKTVCDFIDPWIWFSSIPLFVMTMTMHRICRKRLPTVAVNWSPQTGTVFSALVQLFPSSFGDIGLVWSLSKSAFCHKHFQDFQIRSFRTPRFFHIQNTAGGHLEGTETAPEQQRRDGVPGRISPDLFGGRTGRISIGF